MRFHEKCPDCGHVEEKNWRPRFHDTEMDYIEVFEVPELVDKMKPGQLLKDGQWVYYQTKSGKMIYRMLHFILEARAGKFRRRGHLGKFEGGAAAMMRGYNRKLAARKNQTKLEVEA